MHLSHATKPRNGFEVVVCNVILEKMTASPLIDVLTYSRQTFPGSISAFGAPLPDFKPQFGVLNRLMLYAR